MPGYNDPTSATGWTLGSLIAPNVSELADRLFPPILRRLGELPDDALVEGETIEELALVSLFSDARADDDDQLLASTDGKRDRRGWWAEGLGDDPNDRFGSRLWLLSRAKVTDETKALAVDYAREALDWIVADGLAESVEVELLDSSSVDVGLLVRIIRGDGRNVVLQFPSLWDSVNNGF